MGAIKQREYVRLVLRSNLTERQLLALRLHLGIDDDPIRRIELRKYCLGPYHMVERICRENPSVAKLLKRLRFPSKNNRISPNPYVRDLHMTLKKAERIIGSSIAILEEKGAPYVTVSCRDCTGSKLTEVGKTRIQALEFLVRSNYAKSREFVFTRDGWRCTNCGSFKNLHADHKESRTRGERDDQPDNLVTLCAACHEIRHKAKGFHGEGQ